MEFLVLYFILSLFILLLSITLIILKSIGYSSPKFNLWIGVPVISTFLVYVFNLSAFNVPNNLEINLLTFYDITSQFFTVISLTIYILSFFLWDYDLIELKKPSFYKSKKGEVKIGKVMKKQRRYYKFNLSLEDLERHVFVCGATGSGKSNFVQYLLINFKQKFKIPFMLAEFKGEYTFLQDIIDDLIVIRPGENFSINIFDPEGGNPEIHAERLFDILKSGRFLDESAEFSPQMERVLVDILIEVCSKTELQNWKGFYNQCENYVNSHKMIIPMVEQSLVSIQNRIRRFSLGPLKSIFATRYKIKVGDLFDKNIIFDLSSIVRLGGEKEDALFFLNMVLKYLWDRNVSKGAYNYKGITHITIVEDAQYFAPKDLSYQTKLTSYLEDIALLQRGTGECLISIATRPQVSEEILANCGVLIVFKNHMQRTFISELLNLDEENEDYVSILEKGQCIARVNSIKRPFLLWVPLIDRYWKKRGDVNRRNKEILQKSKSEDPKEDLNNFFNFYRKTKTKDRELENSQIKQTNIKDFEKVIENLLKKHT